MGQLPRRQSGGVSKLVSHRAGNRLELQKLEPEQGQVQGPGQKDVYRALTAYLQIAETEELVLVGVRVLIRDASKSPRAPGP